MTSTTIYKPRYEKSWALVIGINRYQKAPQLGYARQDAEGFAGALIKHLDFPSAGKFAVYVSRASDQESTAATTLTPAALAPALLPPTPANKSIALISRISSGICLSGAEYSHCLVPVNAALMSTARAAGPLDRYGNFVPAVVRARLAGPDGLTTISTCCPSAVSARMRR